MSDVQIDSMPILIADIQAAQKRAAEASRAYIEARAELRVLEAHYRRIMEAWQAAQGAQDEATP